MDAANGAATATISNGGTTVTPAARTAGDTLVGRNITDYTTPDATALRECHSGEQQHPCQRCEQTADKSAGERHAPIIAARQRRRPGFLLLPAASSTSRSTGSPMNVIRSSPSKIKRERRESGPFKLGPLGTHRSPRQVDPGHGGRQPRQSDRRPHLHGLGIMRACLETES
jgi:hypothetical protein